MAVSMIVVAGEILGAEFPVARYLPLDDAADHLVAVVHSVRPLHQRPQIESHVGAEIVLEGRRGLIEGSPDRTVKHGDPRADQAPFRPVEASLVAFVEFRDSSERAVETVGPAVIGTGEAPSVPGVITARGHSAMAAAVQKDMDRVLLIARDDHRLGPKAR